MGHIVRPRHTLIGRQGEGGTLELTIHVPGYDHRYGPEAKPGGGIHNHGVIHGVQAELPDGRKVVLAMDIGTGEYPDTVPQAVVGPPRPDYYPRPYDLTLHVQTEPGKGATCLLFPHMEKCCDRVFTTSLLYYQFTEIERDPKKAGFGQWPHAATAWGDVKHPTRAFWDAMRSKLRVLLRDPTLFAQPDEPPELRAARDGLALAEKQRATADELIAQWEQKKDAALRKYMEGRT